MRASYTRTISGTHKYCTTKGYCTACGDPAVGRAGADAEEEEVEEVDDVEEVDEVEEEDEGSGTASWKQLGQICWTFRL
jgi:hypothetical protein